MANTTGKKFGGREKGTPNRMTSELRSILKDLLHNELNNFESHLNQLEPKERIQVLIKLMPYVFPKLESISHTTNEPFEWDSL